MPYNNIIHTLLELLKVEHTREFTHTCFDTYPSNSTLWAIHNILTDYGVKSIALKVENKDQIHDCSTPFIAHIKDNFCVVREVSKNRIKYIVDEKETDSDTSVFFRIWTGIVLLPEVTHSAIEPNYKENRRKAVTSNIVGGIASVCIALVLLMSASLSDYASNVGWYLLLILNLSNLGIAYTLLVKENRWKVKFADKLCSASKGLHCESIVQKRAKLFNSISWSEIGIAYFLSNIAILTLIPESIHIVTIVSVLALPYTFWSIWYQKYKEKKWCSLCLATQLIIWFSVFISVCYSLISFQQEHLVKYIYALLIYPISLYAVTKFVQIKEIKNNLRKTSYDLNVSKWDKTVFEKCLDRNYIQNNDTLNSNIIIGNKYAKNTITIFTNPYCAPCVKLENHIPQILKSNSFRIQYVFVALSREHEKAIKNINLGYLEYRI